MNACGTDPLCGGYNADAPPQEDTIVLEKVKAPGTILGPEWLLCQNRLGPHCLQQRKLSRRAAPGSQHLEGKEREEAGASAPAAGQHPSAKQEPGRAQVWLLLPQHGAQKRE